jgi:hypothetical protein
MPDPPPNIRVETLQLPEGAVTGSNDPAYDDGIQMVTRLRASHDIRVLIEFSEGTNKGTITIPFLDHDGKTWNRRYTIDRVGIPPKPVDEEINSGH